MSAETQTTVSEPRTREYIPQKRGGDRPHQEKRLPPPEKPKKTFSDIGDTLKNAKNICVLLDEERIVWQEKIEEELENPPTNPTAKNTASPQEKYRECSLSFEEIGITPFEKDLLTRDIKYIQQIISARRRNLALISRKIIDPEKKEMRGTFATLRSHPEVAQREKILTTTLQSLSQTITKEIFKKIHDRGLLERITDFLEPPLDSSDVEKTLFLTLENYFIESRSILAIQSLTPREEVIFNDELGRPQREIQSIKEKSVQKITFADISSFDLPVPTAYQRYVRKITISIDFSHPNMPATCTVT